MTAQMPESELSIAGPPVHRMVFNAQRLMRSVEETAADQPTAQQEKDKHRHAILFADKPIPGPLHYKFVIKQTACCQQRLVKLRKNRHSSGASPTKEITCSGNWFGQLFLWSWPP